MAEEAEVTTPAAGNAPEARTETGEIKDQQTTQPVTTSETKPETTSPKEPPTGTKTETKTDAPVVPDKYEFKAPEGYEVDQKFLDDATPVLKELGLTQEQANKLFDIQAAHSKAAAEEAQRAYEATRAEWRDKVVKDAALGDGKSDLKPEVRKNVSVAIAALGDAKEIDAFKEAMAITGAGDHPAFVAAMNKLGSLLGEGTQVRAGGPAPVAGPNSKPKTAAQAMFPGLPSSAG